MLSDNVKLQASPIAPSSDGVDRAEGAATSNGAMNDTSATGTRDFLDALRNSSVISRIVKS